VTVEPATGARGQGLFGFTATTPEKLASATTGVFVEMRMGPDLVEMVRAVEVAARPSTRSGRPKPR